SVAPVRVFVCSRASSCLLRATAPIMCGTLSLHDALPILVDGGIPGTPGVRAVGGSAGLSGCGSRPPVAPVSPVRPTRRLSGVCARARRGHGAEGGASYVGSHPVGGRGCGCAHPRGLLWSTTTSSSYIAVIGL